MNLNNIANSNALSSLLTDKKESNSPVDGDDRFQQLLQSSEKAQSIYNKVQRSKPQLTEDKSINVIKKPSTLITLAHSVNTQILVNDKQSINQSLKQQSFEDKDNDDQQDNPLVTLLTTSLTPNNKDHAIDSDASIAHAITGEQAVADDELPLLNKQDKPVEKITENNKEVLLTGQDKTNQKQVEAEISPSSANKNSQNLTANITNLLSQANQANQVASPVSEVNGNSPTENSVFSQTSAFNQTNVPNQPAAQATISTVTLPVAVSHPQWQDSFSQQIVMFNRQDIQKAEIRLNPQELGSLHIKLEMNDGKMQLQMAAAHAAVKGVIESALPHLRTSLAEQGIELQQADISDSSMMANSDQQSMFEQNKQLKQGQSFSSSTESDGVIETNINHKGTTHSGLSVFA